MEFGKHSLETEEDEKGQNELGLHTINHGFEKDIEETVTKVIDGSLRSGKREEFQGTIVVIGDINAGAEVIAKDHIIVLGTIRGLAHAGAKGNRKAMIFANEIDAPQIRIADILKEKEMPVYEENGDEGKNKKDNEPIDVYDYYDKPKTRAYIRDNKIVIE